MNFSKRNFQLVNVALHTHTHLARLISGSTRKREWRRMASAAACPRASIVTSGDVLREKYG